MFEVRRGSYEVQAQSPGDECPGPCPGGFRVSPRWETPQPLRATCAGAQSKLTYGFLHWFLLHMHVLCIHNKFILRRPIGDGRYYSRDPKCSKVVEDLTWCSFLLTSDTDIYTTVHNTNHLLPVFLQRSNNQFTQSEACSSGIYTWHSHLKYPL